MSHESVFLGLAVLAVVGVIAVWLYARRVTKKAAKQLRRATGATGQLARTIGIGAGITGFQWLIVSYVHDWHVLLPTLGIPGLLAGRTVARMFAVAELARGDY